MLSAAMAQFTGVPPAGQNLWPGSASPDAQVPQVTGMSPAPPRSVEYHSPSVAL